MKRFKIFAGAALMAAFVFTGCIDNEESEGVKALRKAQAGLIDSKAYQTTLEARADSAFAAIKARVDIAQAIIDESKAALEVAKDDNERATLGIKLQIELLKQNAILANEERNLALAQKNLEIALSDYEAELAEDRAKNKNLDKYLVSYRNAINFANALQTEIIGLQANLLKASNLALDFNLNPTGTILELKQIEKATLVRTLALNEAWLVKAESVHGNTVDRHAAIVDAREKVQALITQIDVIDVEINGLDEEVAIASNTYSSALIAYNDATNAEDKVEDFTDGAGVYTIPQAALEVIADIPTAGPANFRSLKTLNDNLDLENELLVLLQEARSLSSSYLSRANAIKNQYGTALTNAETAEENAEKAVATAEHNLNLAELQLATDPTNATFQNNVATRETQLTAATTTHNNALTALNNLKSQIDGVVISPSDYYWQQWASNMETIDWLIERYENELENRDVDVANKQEDIADIELDITIVTAYIAHLQTVEAGDIAALKTAYFAARAIYWAKLDEKTELNADKAILNLEKNWAQNLENELMGNYNPVNNLIDNLKNAIAGNKSSIANLDVDFATWDSYKAHLTDKIAQKQTELEIRKKESATFKALIDAELAGE